MIYFTTKLLKAGRWTIIKIPKDASSKLPSRGQTMVDGTINGFYFQSPLEPDGMGSHWFKVDKKTLNGAGATAGDTIKVEVEPSKVWPEPEVPGDLKRALSMAPKEHKLWMEITPMARWDWIRWIGSTKNPDTRAKHIEVTLSKLRKGERRPCCFNRTICTDPELSAGGRLSVGLL